MRSNDISPPALAFMDDHIASAEELALLVALVEAPSRWWDPAIVSRELGIPAGFARAILDRFAAENLLDMRVTDDVRYQFRPGTPELQEGAVAVANAYRAHPVAVVQHLAQGGARSVRDSAAVVSVDHRRDGSEEPARVVKA